MKTKSLLIGAFGVLVAMSLACGEDYIPDGGGPLFVEDEDMSSPVDDMSTPDRPDQAAPPADMSQPPADMAQPPVDMGQTDPPDMPPPPDMSRPPEDTSDLAAIVRIANMHRATGYSCGGQQMAPVGPLVMDEKLQIAAQRHAQDMATNNYFSHEGQDGSSFSSRSTAAGYTGFPSGENIAAGNGTPEATMEQWMNSPGHCRNIMSGGSNEIGVGHGLGGQYGHYWVQKFGRR